MDPTPKIPSTPEPGPKILSFEEFIHREKKTSHPHYNNFHLNFSGGEFVQEANRRKIHNQRFMLEQPKMYLMLCKKIKNREKLRDNTLRPYDRLLYEAYKIMRSYGVSDKDLFS